MITITIYGQPGCQQCTTTTRHLTKLGLPYTYRDVTQDEEARDCLSLLGYRSLPVVTVGDVHWSGYRHGRIERLAEILGAGGDITGLDVVARAYLDGASA